MHNWRIYTITIHISLNQRIRIQEPLPVGAVEPASEVVQQGFGVVDVPPVAEGIQRAQGGGQGAGGGEDLAPGVVGVSHHLLAGTVNQPQHIPLQVVDIGVFRAAVIDDRRPVLGIVPEMHIFAALHQVHQVLAVIGILRGAYVPAGAGEFLCHPQPVGVVGVLNNRPVGMLQLFQLPPVLPGVCPVAVGDRIADGIVGDVPVVESGQLVLPGCVAVDVGDSSPVFRVYFRQ